MYSCSRRSVCVCVCCVFFCPLANKYLWFSWCSYLCFSWQVCFVFQRVILREAHRSGALLCLSQAAVMGLIACGHIYLFSSCYLVRCGFPLSKHEIFLYICSVLITEDGTSVCRNICTITVIVCAHKIVSELQSRVCRIVYECCYDIIFAVRFTFLFLCFGKQLCVNKNAIVNKLNIFFFVW